MSLEKELADAFRKLGKRSVDTFVAEVVSVDKEKGICVVKDDTIEYDEVRLCAVINAQGNKFFIFPKQGSTVLVSPIKEDINDLYVEEYSEIEAVEIEIGQAKFAFDTNGFLFKKSNETLSGLINELIAAIIAITVPTAVGPSGVPINAAQFTSLQTRFQTLLKTN
ncbi:MAG: hypothetical protein LC096_05450 [Bacteroidia bacterium]|nr:hypothetical protein [Bacteroidia bacterium]